MINDAIYFLRLPLVLISVNNKTCLQNFEPSASRLFDKIILLVLLTIDLNDHVTGYQNQQAKSHHAFRSEEISIHTHDAFTVRTSGLE